MAPPGLLLVAALALSVVVASAASAQQGKLTSDGPFTLKTTETGAAGSNTWTAFGLRTECPGSTIIGHKNFVTPHTLISSGESTVTLNPTYVNCVILVGASKFPMTVDMNVCDYVIHMGATTGGVAGTYGATLDIVCPVGKEIVETMFTNASDHAAFAQPMCKLDIKAQTGIPGGHITDEGKGDLSITGTFEKIHVTRTKTTHALLCPEATTNESKIDIDATVKGFNAEGKETNISISE